MAHCPICGGNGVWPNCCQFCAMMSQSVNLTIYKVIDGNGNNTGQHLWRVWIDGSVYADGLQFARYLAEAYGLAYLAKAKAELGWVDCDKLIKIEQACVICGQTAFIREGLETCDQCVEDFRRKWQL